ncbi:MAG: NAD(P)H-binding protein [Chloroflexi bacterium]|nr:NAD(P)H-binding protein [Chloroflexota bacterium]
MSPRDQAARAQRRRATGAWLLYGAYGYTGRLLAEEALRRGHRPLLAGRSEARLGALAERLGLDYRVFGLEDERALAAAIAEFDLVLHAAGPFVFTAPPMMRACIASRTHYLDITGEIPVFEQAFTLNQAARDAGIALLPGVGLDVIPTDCLARFVAQRAPDATELELALASVGGSTSAGTAHTMLKGLHKGNVVRRQGRYQPIPFGWGQRRVRFMDRERTVIAIPWGDLATAFRTTGIPNITTYMAFPSSMIRWIRRVGGLLPTLFASRSARRMVHALIDRLVRGPNETQLQRGRTYIWARAAGPQSESEAWLVTPQGYRFTALAGVRCVERILAQPPVGAITPALAFGADFVLEIPDVERSAALD